jgi:nucleoside-diphosphate kinase
MKMRVCSIRFLLVCTLSVMSRTTFPIIKKSCPTVSQNKARSIRNIQSQKNIPSRFSDKTFALIKPDAVSKRHIGAIIQEIEREGFTITALKMMKLSRAQAAAFYQAHKEKPFFQEVIDFITSGNVIVLILQKQDAVAQWRTVMGATDPAKAQSSSVRKKFGSDVMKNAVHGSDSAEAAVREITIFFPEYVENEQ